MLDLKGLIRRAIHNPSYYQFYYFKKQFKRQNYYF